MRLRRLMLLGFALASSSCVLPIPHRRVHKAGVEGKVIAATTKEPIAGAEVREAISGSKLTVNGPNGMFHIKPNYGWHGAYLVGPISYSLLPYFDMTYPPTPIRIAASGYKPKEFHAPQLSNMKEFALDRQ